MVTSFMFFTTASSNANALWSVFCATSKFSSVVNFDLVVLGRNASMSPMSSSASHLHIVLLKALVLTPLGVYFQTPL